MRRINWKNLGRLAIIAIYFVAVITPIILTSHASATGAPDTNPAVYDVHANRNLITVGDACIFGRYRIPYTTIPTEGANLTYIIRLLDTDNVTNKGAVQPFVYFDNGYNDGAFGLYFSSNITWDSMYIIRISQNPAYFASPQSYDYVMSPSNYSTETGVIENSREMASKILLLANYLETQYPTYTLVESGPANSVLAAPQGETYFRGAIPEIQNMAPSIFLTSVENLDYTSNNWTLTQAQIYENRMGTTDIGASENATSTQFGMTRQTILSVVFIVPLCLGALIISTAKFKKSTVGLLVSSVFITMGFTLGWVPAPIFSTVHQIMGIYTGYVWFLARS